MKSIHPSQSQPLGLTETSSLNWVRILQNELDLRKQDNSSYSMRAFARQLGLEPSYLSKILRGKRKVTDRLVHRLLPRLSSFKQQKRASDANTNWKELGARWQEFAILDLANRPGFQLNTKWISSVLEIPEERVELTLQKLICDRKLEGERR